MGCERSRSCYADDLTLIMGWGGVGWGGMLTFMFMLRCWCYVDDGVGWGGMLTFMFMLRCWCHVDDGVGWGGMLTFMFNVTLMMLP